jgi:hypothetical protein
MGAAPSIKGVLLTKLTDDVRALLERREVDRDQLEAGLSAGTLELLEGKVDIGRWYPIEQYAELSELIWKEEGSNRVQYLHQRGEDAMKRLMEGGLYQQIEYLRRKEGGFRTSPSRSEVLQSCRLVGSIMGALLNFTTQSWDWDPENPEIMLHQVRGATRYPEVLRYVQEGTLTFLVRLARPDAPAVTSERVAPDHVVFAYDYTGVFETGE